MFQEKPFLDGMSTNTASAAGAQPHLAYISMRRLARNVLEVREVLRR